MMMIMLRRRKEKRRKEEEEEIKRNGSEQKMKIAKEKSQETYPDTYSLTQKKNSKKIKT